MGSKGVAPNDGAAEEAGVPNAGAAVAPNVGFAGVLN